MVVLLCKALLRSIQASKMESNHQVNWNSIIYRNRATHRTEIKRPLSAAKSFDTNLVQFLPPYHVIIRNIQICFVIGAIFYVHRHVKLKRCSMHKILCMQNYNLSKPEQEVLPFFKTTPPILPNTPLLWEKLESPLFVKILKTQTNTLGVSQTCKHNANIVKQIQNATIKNWM